MNKTTMEQWLPNFTQEVQRLLGYSPMTARAYTSDIRRFWNYLNAQQKEVHPEKLTAEDVMNFLRSEAAQGYRRTTIHRRLASLRVLERCLLMTERIEQGFVPEDEQVLSVLEQSPPPRRTTCLAPEEVHRLWKVLLASPKRQAVRDLAFMALSLEWGFSSSFLLGMEIHQVDLEKRVVWMPHVSGSLEKWPLDNAYEPLRRYIEQGRNDFVRQQSEQHLFLSQQGSPLSRQSVWHAMRQWGSAAQLEMTLTPRVLRATAAYRMMQNGLPTHTIGAALGHTNPLSTTLLLQRLKANCEGRPVAGVPSLDEIR